MRMKYYLRYKNNYIEVDEDFISEFGYYLIDITTWGDMFKSNKVYILGSPYDNDEYKEFIEIIDNKINK